MKTLFSYFKLVLYKIIFFLISLKQFFKFSLAFTFTLTAIEVYKILKVFNWFLYYIF